MDRGGPGEAPTDSSAGSSSAETRVPSPPRRPPRFPRLSGFLLGPSSRDEGAEDTHPWWKVLWLTGVDYFSTLGYQPGIAFLAAGVLSPVATGVLIAVTLLGALPVYAMVARYSYIGQGSIAMLENLLAGWKGKLVVLGLLGFAATDFVITITLSAADAAQHAVENPILHPFLGEARLATTLTMITLLAVVFLAGLREAIRLAILVAVPYLLLTLVIAVRGFVEIGLHPEHLSAWTGALELRGDWTAMLLASVVIFPKLALGMSGFETGVAVMPAISGGDSPERGIPRGRIRATRKLLLTAALIMSVMLLISSFVTTILIPAAEFAPGGKANGRAMAYLAHGLLGDAFGSVYDLSTILILWFAGASAVAGLLNLIPRYLPRFGMAPRWVEYRRPLVLVIYAISVVVTLIFNADVDAQGGAYATGVLVLMLSAAVAVALALWRQARDPRVRGGVQLPFGGLYFWLISGVFAFTLVDNVIERPDGVIIATIFTFFVLVSSGLSRWWRATELRVESYRFIDERSRRLWEEIRDKKVHLVPIAFLTPEHVRNKVRQIREYYRADGQLCFLMVASRDDRSEFTATLRIQLERWDASTLFLTVSGAVAIPNTIAWVSEQIDPISIFLSLARKNLMTQAFKHLLWGEGEIGLLVYEVLLKHWQSTPEEDVRPRIFLLSE